MPIVTTIEGKIAQIAIDRPEKRNTLNSELCKDLAREFLELNDDTRVRSIVLCGHNNVFCAGLDIEEQLAENTQIFSELWEKSGKCLPERKTGKLRRRIRGLLGSLARDGMWESRI